MIQQGTVLKVADNTGALTLKVITVLRKRVGKIGDVVSCAVGEAKAQGVVSAHDKVRAVIVRTKKEFRRDDGSYIRFSDNAAVLIDKKELPRGTRILGPVAREVKEKFPQVGALAKEVY